MLETAQIPEGYSFSNILVLFNLADFLAGGIHTFGKGILERHNIQVCFSIHLPSVDVTSKDKYLFQILTAACRKSITKKWSKPERSKVDDRFDTVYDIFKMERIIFAIRLQQGLLYWKTGRGGFDLLHRYSLFSLMLCLYILIWPSFCFLFPPCLPL